MLHVEELYRVNRGFALKKLSALLITTLALCIAFIAVQPGIAANSKQTSKFRLFWPPQLNNYYPDIELQSLSGKKVKLSQYAGKVLLIEPIGLSCPACQAFAGGDTKGSFCGVSPQPGLQSIERLMASNGISGQDPRIVKVQLLLYGPTLQAPTMAEARAWAKHFGFGSRPNEVVLIADSRYQNDGSYNMIPGFQVVDKDFVLRSDSSGHQPKNDLYRHLLPTLKNLLR